ncbi:MAG: SDR family oxidoreductase [Alphaproteobacteria bacterium]
MSANPAPIEKKPVAVPKNGDLGDWIESRIARYRTRTYDWDALKFQADFDPKYRRAQMRYMGTGGTGVSGDANTVPSEHFTFSTMVLPSGCEGPMHIHEDVEEVFFMLRGTVRLFVEHEGETCETELSERDLISVPPGVYRGLLNNAALATGIGGKGFEEIDIETWDRVMRVNIRGTWLVVKACAPLLRRATSGARIVNIASDTALWGAPDLLHYVATKGAIIAMTRSLAREMGKDGIAVNAVAPGLTIGEASDYVPPERHTQYVEGRAMPRAQQAEDVVGSVVFLLSDAAGFVSGQLLPVNGGFVFN